jgi:hypothetical protein
MSLNELLDVLKLFISRIPFSLFDYILLFGFVGYVVEEESYNVGVVVKRTISLLFCTFLALFLYRFPSLILQDSLFISKGIADGIALLGVWIISIGVSGIISHFVIKERMNAFLLDQKLKIPSTIILSVGGFLSLVWIIIHVFISLPLPVQAKSLLTSSFIVQKVLIGTLKSDVMIQKIYTNDPSSALHVQVINEQDDKKDLRAQTPNPSETKTGSDLLSSINIYRKSIGRGEIAREELLSSVAHDLALKYAHEGIIEFQASHLASILDERGTLFSNARTVTIISDSEILIPSVILSNQSTNAIIRDPDIARMGSSQLRLNGSTFLTVFVLTN